MDYRVIHRRSSRPRRSWRGGAPSSRVHVQSSVNPLARVGVITLANDDPPSDHSRGNSLSDQLADSGASGSPLSVRSVPVENCGAPPTSGAPTLVINFD
jgi:hypothetical protein